MTVRPLGWRDIPTLRRYRQQSIFLNSNLLLTRGPLLVQGALLSSIAPGMGIFTGVYNDKKPKEPPLIGQFIHNLSSQFAHLTFLAPQDMLETTGSSVLLDYLVWMSGERGALRLLADVDEASGAFESMRKNGFAIYTRQRVWQSPAQAAFQKPEGKRPSHWRAVQDKDTQAIRSLYHSLVPGLVQQVEPFLAKRTRGLVLYQNDDLLAYVELKYGHRGVWVQPFVHPDTENISGLLTSLLINIPNRPSRPLYLCVRSYQSWLEMAIEELGAQAGPRQAVMVRHLALQQKVEHGYGIPALEGGRPEVTTPFVRQIHDTSSNNGSNAVS